MVLIFLFLMTLVFALHYLGIIILGGDFMKIIFDIFLSIFKIGAFTFGGGYAMIPLIEQEVVSNKKWLNKDEFMDVLVVAQSLPGAMAINTSIFLGYKIAGILGAISALIAVILPSFMIIILIAAFFMQFRNNYYVNAAFMGITAAVPMLVLVGAISLGKGIPKNLRSLITIVNCINIFGYKSCCSNNSVRALWSNIFKREGIAMKLLIKLYLAFLKIGTFSFGGGYAMLPFIQKEIVEKNDWISSTEFTDIIGISQMTPGPVAINSATFVGYKINGVIGSIVATFGVITTSFILVIIINRVLDKFKESKTVKSALLGMRPALIALIIYAFWDLAIDAYKDWKSIVITLIIAVVLWSKKVHPILVIVIAAILGLVLYI